jgi:hypothetical protein
MKHLLGSYEQVCNDTGGKRSGKQREREDKKLVRQMLKVVEMDWSHVEICGGEAR